MHPLGLRLLERFAAAPDEGSRRTSWRPKGSPAGLLSAAGLRASSEPCPAQSSPENAWTFHISAVSEAAGGATRRQLGHASTQGAHQLGGLLVAELASAVFTGADPVIAAEGLGKLRPAHLGAGQAVRRSAIHRQPATPTHRNADARGRLAWTLGNGASAQSGRARLPPPRRAVRWPQHKWGGTWVNRSARHRRGDLRRSSHANPHTGVVPLEGGHSRRRAPPYDYIRRRIWCARLKFSARRHERSVSPSPRRASGRLRIAATSSGS